MKATIVKGAVYRFTTTGEELRHGSVYNRCFPEHGAEFVKHNVNGTEVWEVAGVTMPDYLEELFDTDDAVLSYRQIAPAEYDGA